MAVAFALVMSALSALSAYGASGHCPWRWLRGSGARHRWVAILSGLLALASWILALGVGEGVCAMVLAWMLAAMAWPCIAAIGTAREAG